MLLFFTWLVSLLLIHGKLRELTTGEISIDWVTHHGLCGCLLEGMKPQAVKEHLTLFG